MQLSINTFTHKVGSLGSSNDGIDMRKWYEMVSFDILGQMAFGESFNCVKNGMSFQCPQVSSMNSTKNPRTSGST